MYCETVYHHRIVLFVFLEAIFFLTFLLVATPIPASIKGTVIEVNAQDQTLTMAASCEENQCVLVGCGGGLLS